MTVVERLEKLAAQTPGLPWLTYEAGVSHVDGTDYLAICTADGNQDVIQSTNVGALAFMEPALAEVIVAAVNALPDLLKVARAASEEHLARPCTDMRCVVCIALVPLFDGEGQQ